LLRAPAWEKSAVWQSHEQWLLDRALDIQHPLAHRLLARHNPQPSLLFLAVEPASELSRAPAAG
jgi:hypothetical protein